MDILSDILGTASSALSGGIFGLVGNVAGRVLGFIDDKQQFAQKQAEWSHDVEMAKLQMQQKTQDTDASVKVADTQGQWSGLAPSIEADGVAGASYPWVNAVRALVRPALTLGLAAFLATAFFVMAPGDIDRAYVADSLVFAAVTSIVWWFGDRAPAKRPQR